MPTIRIDQFEDSFVIHFGTEFTRINAYTLATTLTNLADAAKAANTAINPGYEIEVVVEALGDGSFRTKLRTLYEGASNLFSGTNLKPIILSMIATFIYQNTFTPDSNVKVNVGTSEVVISHKDTKVVVPRAVHDALQQVERSPQFRKGIGQAMRAVESDPKITSLGFGHEVKKQTLLEIPRERFAVVPKLLADEGDNTRELVEITNIQILRAILERSTRRWEFVWNGMRISAPVTDQRFYNDFFARQITIAPSDALRVRLKIRQQRAKDLGIFINESFEVVEVLQHLPRSTQQALQIEQGKEKQKQTIKLKE